MAIFHLNHKTGSRAKGQSAKSKSQYVLRLGKYAKKAEDDLIASHSSNIPAFAQNDPVKFWNAADKNERANATLFREIEFALPHELDLETNRKMAIAFANSITGRDKNPYTLAIHDTKDGNLHAHLVISDRKNIDSDEMTSSDFFSKKNPKTREFSKYGFVKDIRKNWQKGVNLTLEKEGHEARIDHRSLEEQGSARTPEPHYGPYQWRKIKEKEEQIAQLDSEIKKEEKLQVVNEVENDYQNLLDELDISSWKENRNAPSPDKPKTPKLKPK